MKPAATILIPLLRQQDKWLKEAVASAVGQSLPCEVLVVTSPHTPASNQDVLKRLQGIHPNLVVIERDPQMRFAAALNLGFGRAASDRVGLLLSDDWLDPRALELTLPHDADIVSAGRTLFGPGGMGEPLLLERPNSKAEYRKLKSNSDRANYLSHFFLFRKTAVLAVGGVDETVGDSPGVDDFHLIWTMLDAGASVGLVEESVYCYRDHPGERLTTRRKEDMLATFGRILDKHGVTGSQRESMIRQHSAWFGRSMFEYYQELAPPSLPGVLEPFRGLYRALLPFPLRVAIHERMVRPWRAIQRGRQ
jgi:glycosyltransferase involved in cell wall biosynthesis